MGIGLHTVNGEFSYITKANARTRCVLFDSGPWMSHARMPPYATCTKIARVL
jgi:hypothetical protein